MTSPLQNIFFMYAVTATEIELEISKLKNGKSTGPYSIPIAILKQIKHIISEPLAILYNMSFNYGTLPVQFKLAQVIPIYKKGEHTTLANYRPISLLSVFDKLLEKLVSKRLLNFLEKFKILFDNQFGFRSKYSTDFALLKIVDKIQSAIDEHDYSCGIFLDFSKAFDTVNHEILLKKLEYYGIRGNAKKWFSSQSFRSQTVCYNRQCIIHFGASFMWYPSRISLRTSNFFNIHK